MTDKTPEQLVQDYGDMVYRLAYAQTRSRHDAEDVLKTGNTKRHGSSA